MIREILSSSPVFKGAGEHTANQLVQHARFLSINANKITDFTGSGCIYLITEGHLKIVNGKTGKGKILFILKPGDVIGLNTLLSSDHRPYSGTALRDVRLICWENKLIKRLLTEDSAFMISTVRYLSKMTNKITERSHAATSQNVRDRIMKTVKEFKRDFGISDKGYLNLKLSMKDWADYTSSKTSEVYHAFDELEERKMINFE